MGTRAERTECDLELSIQLGLEAALTGADPSARAPPSQCLFNCVVLPSFLHFSPSASLIAPFRSFTHQHLTSSHMCKKYKDKLIHVHTHVHPPFPSFAWVMTAQANPPTQAYAYGYIRNARALHPRLLAHRATPPGRHRPYARFSRPPPSPARAKIEPCDEKFMETVDYRYHDDPPSRPYVPWLEGYKLQGRDAQQLWHKQQLKRAQLPPGLAIAAPVIAQRPKKRVIVDVVKHKRLDIALNALRRACGLSGKEPSKSSTLT